MNAAKYLEVDGPQFKMAADGVYPPSIARAAYTGFTPRYKFIGEYPVPSEIAHEFDFDRSVVLTYTQTRDDWHTPFINMLVFTCQNDVQARFLFDALKKVLGVE